MDVSPGIPCVRPATRRFPLDDSEDYDSMHSAPGIVYSVWTSSNYQEGPENEVRSADSYESFATSSWGECSPRSSNSRENGRAGEARQAGEPEDSEEPEDSHDIGPLFAEDEDFSYLDFEPLPSPLIPVTDRPMTLFSNFRSDPPTPPRPLPSYLIPPSPPSNSSYRPEEKKKWKGKGKETPTLAPVYSNRDEELEAHDGGPGDPWSIGPPLSPCVEVRSQRKENGKWKGKEKEGSIFPPLPDGEDGEKNNRDGIIWSPHGGITAREEARVMETYRRRAAFSFMQVTVMSEESVFQSLEPAPGEEAGPSGIDESARFQGCPEAGSEDEEKDEGQDDDDKEQFRDLNGTVRTCIEATSYICAPAAPQTIPSDFG
ncbi:hypothetical protein SODALDRAFT_182829 [Sodiomyces alkalinus F11]|uniref:Uncharacterized protein n=1 Tax=Sodiomyces alkalinus (strain CBS 110278 / VKM F-3762 / F11) TaxID=1314773 RepID=A0A3N2PUI9_SODAK|nr:hypothetical protein SODALDRAFT_182829 [Sodiomyces alkalinus F11]ROT38150.1 hypothetical protein SODALDRAFT_182829 [Sodiomyces alkalinus F11]